MIDRASYTVQEAALLAEPSVSQAIEAIERAWGFVNRTDTLHDAEASELLAQLSQLTIDLYRVRRALRQEA